MKFKIYIILQLLITSLYVGCQNNNNNIDEKSRVTGDWYSFKVNRVSNNLESEEKINYWEVLFSENNVFFSYSDVSGFKSPLKYKIIKDSLFWFFESKEYNLKEDEKEFIGNITIIKDSLLVIKNESDSLVFYKLNNSLLTTLSKTLIYKDSLIVKTNNNYEKFILGFRERKEVCFEKNK